MFKIADPAEAEKIQVSQPKKGDSGKTIMWILIILGVLVIVYLIYAQG